MQSEPTEVNWMSVPWNLKDNCETSQNSQQPTSGNRLMGLALREALASLWRLRCGCCASLCSSGSAAAAAAGDLSRRFLPRCSPAPQRQAESVCTSGNGC